ncbi:MAG: hypothetical protein IT287_05190 [Bdellovibrionaceae bacterium]|nr:hypothetical protein [Pseudobdellovibrionaceae bacterium]
MNIPLLFAAAFFTISCSSGSSGGGAPAYVCTSVNHANGITITGNGEYEFRNNGNGIISLTKNPIRYAEVKVFNSNGALIQCSRTDATGAFSVVVPDSDATNTLRISSIIYNTETKAFVYNNPTNNSAHYIETTFTADSTKSLGTLTADADGDLQGGAFNILDKVHSANEYLISETTGCSGTISSCPSFTGAPSVKIYWDKGVNPGTYFGAGPISFYLPGERELYILGGESGDVDSSDCDHFDNSIILHEYGHFIEDVFSDTDSPGGTHTGDTILDARLAWGEGWANFFQAAVLDNPLYRDTSGNISGSTTIFFNENLETPGDDIPSTNGEGNFREFSITRLLWDAIDSTNEGAGVDEVESAFAELWTVFANTTNGFKASSNHFRNIGLFHTVQQALGVSDWSSIRTGEKHTGSQADYARTVTKGGSCGAINIQAANIGSPSSPEDGSFSNSNQFASNDFYQIYHPGGSFSWQLSYTTNPATPADLDLYLYSENYIFGGTSLGSSTSNISVSTSSATEGISLTNLSAGYYMLNVRVDTGVRLGDAASYSMTLGGQALCPN